MRTQLGLAGAAAVLASCAVNYAVTPYFECQLQWRGNCTEPDRSSVLNSVYTRSVSVACFASTAVGWSRYRVAAAAYGARVRAHDAYSSTAAAAAAEARGHVAFRAAVLAANALLIVPFAVADVVTMADEGQSVPLLLHSVVMHAHNAVTCLWEWRFVALCYVLYTKFAKVNRDMEAVGRRIVDPAVAAAAGGGHDDGYGDSDENYDDRCGSQHECSRSDDSGTSSNHPCRGKDDSTDADDGTTVDPGDLCRMYGGDDNDELWVAEYNEAGNYVYRSQATGRQLADAVERLKIRHRLIREAVGDLKYAFIVPVGASLCNLCVLALFEIYDYNQEDAYDQKSIEFLVIGLAQYAFRFFIIVATAHAMTKQALRSKPLISLINQHFLDNATKEESQVFFSQISSSSLEFTIYNLFTINTQLFTSAIGACITYLVIILQIKSNYQQIYPTT